MSESQKALLARTASLLKPFHPQKTLLYALIASVVVLAILYFAADLWDWRLSLAVLAMTIAYDFGKDGIVRFRTRRVLLRQCEHVLSRFPATEFYIPLVENQGGWFVVKPAGIAFEANSAWFVTYKQPLFSTVPQDSIRVPAGSEFQITAFDESLGKPWLSFKANLIARQMHLAVPNEPDLTEKIRGLAPHLQKEA
jgi:hypothetical protein